MADDFGSCKSACGNGALLCFTAIWVAHVRRRRLWFGCYLCLREKWEINLKVFPDKRNLSSNTETGGSEPSWDLALVLSWVDRNGGQGSAGKPFNLSEIEQRLLLRKSQLKCNHEKNWEQWFVQWLTACHVGQRTSSPPEGYTMYDHVLWWGGAIKYKR